MNPFKTQINGKVSEDSGQGSFDSVYLFAFLPILFILVLMSVILVKCVIARYKLHRKQVKKLSFIYNTLSRLESSPSKRLSKVYEAIVFQFGDHTDFYQPSLTAPV